MVNMANGTVIKSVTPWTMTTSGAKSIVKALVVDGPVGPPGPGASDSAIAAYVADVNSQVRAALNAVYARIGWTDVTTLGVKGDGVTNDAPAIQAAFDLHRPVYFPAGNYICNGNFLLDAGTKIMLDVGARLIRTNVGSSGSTGSFFQNRSLTVPIDDFVLCGQGKIGVQSTSVNVGNVFALYGNRMRLLDHTIDSWGGGRAYLLTGDDILMDNATVYGCPPVIGNGGIRVLGGKRFVGANLNVVSGDDVFQFVPSGAPADPWFSQSIYDSVYMNSVGKSTAARLCVAANQGTVADGIATMNNNIQRCAWIGVKGSGAAAGIVVQNYNSTGTIEDLLFSGVSIDMNNSTAVPTADIFVSSFYSATPALDVIGRVKRTTFRDVSLVNPGNASVQVHNAGAEDTLFENCNFERSVNDPTDYVMKLSGVRTTVQGGTVDGAGTAMDVISVNNNEGSSTPIRTVVDGVHIMGIPGGFSGVRFANSTAPRLTHCVFSASSGAGATARGFQAVSTTSDLLVESNDFTELTGTTKFLDTSVNSKYNGGNRGIVEPGAGGSVTDLATEVRWAKPTGVIRANVSRTSNTVATLAALVSGRLTLVGVELFAGDVVTNISMYSGATAMVTPTNQWFSLYTSARALIGTTADDTTNAWAASSIKTLALTTPYTVPTTGLYYVGIMIAAATVPTLSAVTGVGNFLNQTPQLCGASSTGLTTPATAPNPAAALTGIAGIPIVQIT